MLIKWSICLFLVSVVVAAPQHKQCPKECNCSTRSEAVCTTLDLEEFGMEILKLKVINPKEPLILNGKLFKRLGLESLNLIWIENATIAEIDDTTFDGLKILTHASFVNVRLPKLPSKLFEKLPELKVIEFSKSKLFDFTEIKSKTVEQIILSECDITELPVNAFSSCPNLIYLNLEKNKLNELDNLDLSNIEEINLSYNNIKNLETAYLAITLNLSHNPIESLGFAKYNNSVEKLILNSCNLKNADFIKDLTNLMYLDLSNNKIPKLEEDLFKNMVDLETLDVSHNSFKAISADLLKNNIKLNKIVFDGNDLKTLPIFDPSTVAYMSCDSCNIEILDSFTFQNTPALHTIVLSNNKLQNLPAQLLQKVNSLVKIVLSNNLLRSVPNELFYNNRNLMNVDLSNNPLRQLESSVFANNKVLKHLDLSSCEIEDLWPHVKQPLPALEHLNLANNQIQEVTIDTLKLTPHLKHLDLNNNDLLCTPVFTDMFNYMNENDISDLPFAADDVPSLTWLKQCPIEENAIDEQDEDALTFDQYDENDKDDDIDDDDNEEEDSEDDFVLKKDISFGVFNKYPEKEDNYIDLSQEEDFIEEASSNMLPRREIIVFLLPTLVFVLTALVVLIITVAALLFILNRRNMKKPSNISRIQIKVPSWGNGKIKKHSGSVYRPLSEEKITIP